MLAAVWFIPGISVYLRLAAVMLGAALFLEGVGRLRAAAHKRQPRRTAQTDELPQELPPRVYELGGLSAVYRTANSWADSLALVFMGLSFACGEAYLVDWFRRGAVRPKLLVAVAIVPALVAYLFYRAARNLLQRWRVLLFARGLVIVRGRRIDVYGWDKVAAVSHAEIGDAIDERAVEVRLKGGEAPLRFTCCHFRNLDRFWERIRHEVSSRSPAAGDGEDDGMGLPDSYERSSAQPG
jgi:hypothetical protein